MGMERKKFTVYGRVQRVGYRDRVAEIARKMGVKGFARNLEDEVSVEIVAEGEHAQLGEFARQMNIMDAPIEVERIVESEDAATGEFRHFKIIRGEPNEELGERIDVASGLLYGIGKKQDETNAKIDGFHKDMAGKQDQTNSKLDSFNNNTTGRFDIVDTKYGKISDKLEKISVSLDKLVVILGNFGK